MTIATKPAGGRSVCVAATLLAAAALAASFPVSLPAQQQWRTVTAQRQRQPMDTLRVRMLYGAGKLQLGAAPDSLLYDIRERFDATRTRETHRYDAATHTLTVGSDSAVTRMFSLRKRAFHASGDDNGQGSDLTLGLVTGIPLDLDLELGATESTIDLSKLSVSRLELDAAASAASLIFGTVNPVEMQELTLRTGAAGLDVRQLGNARARLVHLNSGVGSVTLDLSGDWTGRMTLDVHSVLGQITIRVPSDVGVESHLTKLIGNVDQAGFTQKNGVAYSANWSSATRTIVVNGEATLASV
ncbi:MAG: hypothetical protein ACRENC_16085, partial [Gemmatimonadaceae bacterium]